MGEENPKRRLYRLEIDPSLRIREADLHRIMDLIRSHAGLPTEAYSFPALQKAIERRQQALGVPSATEYLSFIEGPSASQEELTELSSLLVIQKTSFFRDRFHFDLLSQEVIPELLITGNRLGVWSAGCATGEEAYSIGITLRRIGLTEVTAGILATDLTRGSLKTAEDALFPSDRLSDMTEQERAYFVKVGPDIYRPTDSLRAMVSFQRHNLLTLPYPRPDAGYWDVVFCRNVLIYFDRETICEVIRRMWAVIRPGGYLFLGASESLFQMSEGFELCNQGEAYVYRRLATTSASEIRPITTFRPSQKSPSVPLPNRPTLTIAEPLPPAPAPSALRRPAPGAPVGRGPVPPDEGWPMPVTRRVVPKLPQERKPQERLTQERLTQERLTQERLTQERIAQARLAQARLAQEPAEEAPPAFDLQEQSPAEVLAKAQRAADNGSLEEAQSWLAALLDSDPLNTAGRFLLAVVLFRLDLLDEAASELRRLIFLEGTFAMGHYYLGLVAEHKGDRDLAIRSFRNASAMIADAAKPLPPSLNSLDMSREALQAACRARLIRLHAEEERRR